MLTALVVATLEHRLLEQQQHSGVVPNTQCINFMEAPTIDTGLDLDLPAAPSSLSDSNSDTRPTSYSRSSEMVTPKSLDSSASLYISDILRVDLYVAAFNFPSWT